jgi:DNA-binding MarR family transcriptional regulator
MLHRFLDTIQAGDVQSLMEIAHKLDISPAMVLQMAKQLTEKGYLQEIGSDCDAAASWLFLTAPFNSACQIIVRHWFLTEKGRSAISGSSMPK